MQAWGHEELSKKGLELLEEELARNNREALSLGAYYLGNWLTDISQVMSFVDILESKLHGPLTQRVDAIAGFADDFLEEVFRKLHDDAPGWVRYVSNVLNVDTFIGELRRSIGYARKEIKQAITRLLVGGHDSELGKACGQFFGFIGYFKHVHPEQGKAVLRMNPDHYQAIFEERFTNYYAHEHLDRPEAPGSTPQDIDYASKVADGYLNRFVVSKKGGPNLYEYLRTHLQVAAGLLAEVDHYWARFVFREGVETFGHEKLNSMPKHECNEENFIRDDNLEFHRYLAKLGHAMHVVEDFFGHSTFVDHAVTALPDSYDRFHRFEQQIVHDRRLRKWIGKETEKKDFDEIPVDEHVVTGFFDGKDTFISMVHFLEHHFDWPDKGVGATVQHAVDYDYRKLFFDAVKLVEEPKEEWAKGSDNEAVDLLKGFDTVENLENLLTESRAEYVAKYVAKEGLPDATPQWVRDYFVGAVKAWTKVSAGAGLGISLFKALKTIKEFRAGPLAWVLGRVADIIQGAGVKLLKAYSSTLFTSMVGGREIGCHSLIAKDSGNELFYRGAEDCAAAVHLYIIYVLTRHGRRRKVTLMSPEPGAPEGLVQKVYLEPNIDWLELLEHFLDHPLAKAAEVTSIKVRKGDPVAVEIRHTTTPVPGSIMAEESLASLAETYRPTFFAGDYGPKEFTWETIADANFPTIGLSTEERKAVVNDCLRREKEGELVSDGINYAFKPNITVWIPYQAHYPLITEIDDDEFLGKTWWYRVMVERQPRAIVQWSTMDDVEALASTVPRHLPRIVAPDEVLELINKGNELRQKLEAEPKLV